VQISAERILEHASKYVATGIFSFFYLYGRVSTISEVVDEVDVEGLAWPDADGGSEEVDLVGDVAMVDRGGESEEVRGDDGRGDR
jgi:hypothetical protein